MNKIISELLRHSTDIDLIETFTKMNVSDKLETVKNVAKVCVSQRDHLFQHRSLLVLATFIEEVIRVHAQLDSSQIQGLLDKCEELLIAPKSYSHSQKQSGCTRALELSSLIRNNASDHLTKALVERCPNPNVHLGKFNATKLSLRNASVRTNAPARLDIGMGGISDIPPYCLERYGNCVNVPIQLNESFPLEVSVEVLQENKILLSSKDTKTTHNGFCLDNKSADIGTLRIHQEVLRFFIRQVLNLDTIDDFYSIICGGLRIESRSFLPSGSGLGISSLLACTFLKALGALLDIQFTSESLFASSVYIENVVGIGGGWEDATAIEPGFKLMESFPEDPLKPRMTRISMDDTFRNQLEESLIIIHTGIRKERQLDFSNLIERYSLGNAKVQEAVESNNQLNKELVGYIFNKDPEGIGRVMTSQWENWKILTENKCTNECIDSLFSTVSPFVWGGRMNGAGQGGCVMFFIKDQLRQKLINAVKSVHGDGMSIFRWKAVI